MAAGAGGSSLGRDLCEGQEASFEDMPGFPKMYVANEMVKCSPSHHLQQVEQLPPNLRQRRKTLSEVHPPSQKTIATTIVEAAWSPPSNADPGHAKYSTPLAPGSQGGAPQKWSEHFFWNSAGKNAKKSDGAAAGDSGFLDQSPMSTSSALTLNSSCGKTVGEPSPPGCRTPRPANLYIPAAQQPQSFGRRHVPPGLDESIRKKLKAATKRLFSVEDRGATAGVLFQIWADFKKRPHEIVPIIILFVVAASAVVSVFTLSNAMRRSPTGVSSGVAETAVSKGRIAEGGNPVDNLNGKYRSIEFAHRKSRLAAEADPMAMAEAGPRRILDEDGRPVGGKKASLKFGFDLRNGGEPEESGTDAEGGGKPDQGQADGEGDQDRGQVQQGPDEQEQQELQKLKASLVLLEELKQVAQLLSKEDDAVATDVPEVTVAASEDPKVVGGDRRDVLDRLKAIKRPSLQTSATLGQQQQQPPAGSFKGAKSAAAVQVVESKPPPVESPPAFPEKDPLKKRRAAPKTPNKALKQGPFGSKDLQQQQEVVPPPGAVKDEDDPFRM